MQQKILKFITIFLRAAGQRSKVKGQRLHEGFTLLEVLIAIGISAGIVVIAGRFNGIIQSLGGLINYQLQAQQDIEIAFQGVVTDIRSMGSSEAGAYAIESAASTSFVFFSDVNRDGLMDRVRYFVATSTLNRGLTAPSGTPPVYVTSTEVVIPLILNVIANKSSFQYFDSSYTGSQAAMTSTVNVTPIRTVRALVTADVATSSAPYPTVVSELITIRNLRSN